MLYLVNGFSANMLPCGEKFAVVFIPLTVEQVREAIRQVGLYSAVGHKELCPVLQCMLGVEVAHNRESITLQEEDEAVLAQYRGPRLPEGATMLPEGAAIDFYFLKAYRPAEVNNLCDLVFLPPPYFRIPV